MKHKNLLILAGCLFFPLTSISAEDAESEPSETAASELPLEPDKSTDAAKEDTSAPDTTAPEEKPAEEPPVAEVQEVIAELPPAQLEQPLVIDAPVAEEPPPAPMQEAPPAAPPLPAKKEPEVKPDLAVTPPEPVEYGEGIDTIDIDSSGNWLQKRVIWEDAQDKYEQIKELMGQVVDSRMQFFSMRSAIDKDVNLFFADTGFMQGELDEVLDDLIKTIDQERKDMGSLDEQERDIKKMLVEKKSELEQLRLDIKSIGELDAAFESALVELMKQINLCYGYDQQAWDRFKAIGQELDDKKAREHYQYMDALTKNIRAIQEYINGPFQQYFSSSMQKMQSQISKIKTSLASLKEKGVELAKEVAAVDDPTPEKPKAPEKEVPKSGWFAPTKNWVASIGSSIGASFAKAWSWTLSWMPGTKKSVVTTK